MATNTAYQPATYDTGIVRGDTFAESFTFMDGENPFSLASAAIRIQIKDQLYASIASFSVGSGLVVSGTNHNILNWTIAASQTDDFPVDTLLWDMEVTIGSTVRTYISGKFNVVRDYTI